MHNLKEIRKNFENFKKTLENRSVEIDFLSLEKFDKENRELIQKKEILEKEKKEISKSKDKSLFEKSKKLSLEILDFEKKQKKIKEEIHTQNVSSGEISLSKKELEDLHEELGSQDKSRSQTPS